MDLKEFGSLMLIFTSITSGILIINPKTIFVSNKYLTQSNSNFEYKDHGLQYLAYAFFVWGLSGIFSQFFSGNNYEIWRIIAGSIFSTINSLLLLIGASHLEHSPNWMSQDKKMANELFATLAGVTIFSTLSIYSYLLITNEIIHKKIYLTIPDFILSIPTVLLLSYSLAMTFWKRKLYVLSIFSAVTLFLILLAQPTIIYDISNNNWVILLNLYCRLSFIIIICLLAYSWAQTKYNIASTRLSSLETRIDALTDTIKSERDNINKIERDMAWRDVAMKAAHIIGNPISAIGVFHTRIVKRLNSQDVKGAKSLLDDMLHEIEDAKTVLSEFKSLTMLSDLKLFNCDIIQLLRQICKKAEEDGIKIKIDIKNKKYLPILNSIDKTTVGIQLKEDDTINILIDKIKIKHCFNELIANSIHWLDKEEKHIEISLETNPNVIPEKLIQNLSYLKIIYSDNGKGIIEENKRNIFNPFFTTYQQGFGLGLAIVSKAIESHHGTIFENGIYGEGARFEIYLPMMVNQKK